MSTKDFVTDLTALGFGTDQAIDGADVVDAVNKHFFNLKYTVDNDARDYKKSEALQEIGKNAMASISEMVAALDCDYDRLEELRAAKSDQPDVWVKLNESDAGELAELDSEAGECTDREEALQRIKEDPSAIAVRGDWVYDSTALGAPTEFLIELSGGGPATRIIGELSEHGEPTWVRLQAQDWFQPWTDYVRADMDTLLAYCRCFYFGEG